MRDNKGPGASALTPQQEIFVNAIIKGKTQRAAFVEAYPKRANNKPNTLDNSASLLFSRPKVNQRYNELLEKFRESEQEKTKWTREQSIESLRFVIDINRKEIKRIQEANEEEISILAEAIKEHPEDAVKLTELMLKQLKQRRISAIHNNGIIEAVSELDKMQGFNAETINLNGSVVYEERDLED